MVHFHGDIASSKNKAILQITALQINSGLVLLVKNTSVEVPSKSPSKYNIQNSLKSQKIGNLNSIKILCAATTTMDQQEKP